MNKNTESKLRLKQMVASRATLHHSYRQKNNITEQDNMFSSTHTRLPARAELS